MSSMRSSIKHAVEMVLVASRIPRLIRRGRRAGVVLVYHNIIPDGTTPVGDSSLHLTESVFAQQVDILAETHDIVPLDGLLHSPNPGALRPRAALTFDDAYRGAVTLGVTALRQLGVPATVFVAPGMLGGKSFWWDALAHGGGGGIGDWARGEALQRLAGVDTRIRGWAPAVGLREVPVPSSALSAHEHDIRVAASEPGITLAPHSWSHPNLTRIPTADLRRELRGPLEWLRERFERVTPWLAYPYGQTSPRVEREVMAAGYVGALLSLGGGLPRVIRNPYRVPRVNVGSGLSLEGFALRLAGLPLT